MTNLESKIAEISRLGITCIKNAANPYFNSTYADLGAVMSNGAGDQWMLTLTVVNLEEVKDEDAEQISDSLVLAFPLNPVDPQKMGASITYAKRYLLCTAFNVIAEEDDDGNEASGNKPTLPKKKPVTLQTKQQAKTIDDIDDEVPSFFD